MEASATDRVVDWLRTLKLPGNLEVERLARDAAETFRCMHVSRRATTVESFLRDFDRVLLGANVRPLREQLRELLAAVEQEAKATRLQ